MSAVLQTLPTARAIVHRTRGQTHGPITRLVSPSELGEVIKPFVFLDHFSVPPSSEPLFGWHPHSGIATLMRRPQDRKESYLQGVSNGCARLAVSGTPARASAR